MDIEEEDINKIDIIIGILDNKITLITDQRLIKLRIEHQQWINIEELKNKEIIRNLLQMK